MQAVLAVGRTGGNHGGADGGSARANCTPPGAGLAESQTADAVAGGARPVYGDWRVGSWTLVVEFLSVRLSRFSRRRRRVSNLRR